MDSVTIVEKGKTGWRIICPSTQRPGLSFAVSEFRKYLRQVADCDVPQVGQGDAAPAVVIGLRSDLAKADAALLPPPAKGHDGYAVCVAAKADGSSPRVVVGADNGRGAIYAVYDLLERIGCRWFCPAEDPKDPEVVPRLDTVRLAAGKWSVASPVPYRIYNGSEWFFAVNTDLAKKQLDWAMKCRYNGMGWQCDHRSPLLDQYNAMKLAGLFDELNRRAMLLHGPGHSFNLFLSSEKYFKDHPEWFGMRDGKRVPQVFGGSQYCWSNAEARKVFIANVEEFLRAAPEMKILCTLGFDGGQCCSCPECAKSTPSNLVIQMMNELIERLEKSVPGVLVETCGGYNPVHDPPVSPKAHPRLRIVWAHWGRNHEMGYDDPRYSWKDNLESWREFVHNHITLCQYYTDNFASPWVAAPYAIALEGDRRYVLRHGIDGWYMLVWPKGYWWNQALNGYLGGVCVYDVSTDPYAAIRDYAMRYFGKDAGPFLAAYYDEWARNPRIAYRVRDDADDADRAMLAAQRKTWIDPAVEAARNDPVHSYRVGKVEKLHTMAERLAEVIRRHQQIRKARAAGEFKKAVEMLEEARVYTDEVIAFLYGLADLEQGLIDRNEIPGFIRMKIKDWIEEEAKAIAGGVRETKKEESKEIDSMDMLPGEVTGQSGEGE